MPYIDPKEPNWHKKAREKNPALTDISTTTNITPIDYDSYVQYTTIPGTITYSSSGGMAYYDGNTFTVTKGADGWQYLEKYPLNKDQQNVFDYLSKVMHFSTK